MFFDMPRAVNKEKMHGMFTAIEQNKKGKVWDSRHSYKEWWYDSPRVWVFTNEFPNIRYLSMDRWRFWKIVDKKLVKVEPPAENDRKRQRDDNVECINFTEE